MNIASAKQQVKDTVEAYLKKDDAGMYVIEAQHQRPVFLLGAPGIGKTAIMEQIAQELGIGIISYSMTHHTRQSALGLPRIEHRVFEGFEYEASEYTMSEIVAAIYDYMTRTGLRTGILFLDEINCVSETLYPSMLQFLQFKIFGKHKIPDGWVVACAGNPPEYNRSVHEFDVVTLDRMREIDVEPDYAAWKSYASEKGLHPAVTTFLETKRDCFYKVESKPGGGKAFVTARGWEDLACTISLYENMGKPIDRDLMVQFIRDDEIANQFSVYYALFEKYRSDYQVDTILSGNASNTIKTRAKDAEFDERIALVSLIIDVLARDCAGVLDLEAIVLELRDELRDVKTDILEGAFVEETLGARIKKREAVLARRIASGTVTSSYVRRERLALASFNDLIMQCSLEKAETGETAFRALESGYKTKVSKVHLASSEASSKMNAAFDFIDGCFGNREMLVFMAELATRQPTTQFIAHYGNDRYYVHNQELQVDAARSGLTDRANMLETLTENISLADSRTVDTGAAVGLSIGSKPAAAKQETSATIAELEKHYGGKQFEYGFASICKMVLPAEKLKGKTVLDICCRRGMGVYKLSSMVGNEGVAIGIDWSAAYIEEAKSGMDHAWHKSGLKHNNMEFKVAYPEDLISAGIGSATIDAIYVNNVMTLFFDQAQAIAEFARVLKPGGLLVMETIFADSPRDEEVVSKARVIGNSIQAARTEAENCAMLSAAGFGEPTVQEEYEVEASRGYTADCSVDTIPSDEHVNYKAVALFVYKR